jgi:hypothetical protein
MVRAENSKYVQLVAKKTGNYVPDTFLQCFHCDSSCTVASTEFRTHWTVIILILLK